MPRISPDKILDFKVPLPSLQEQKRIADILDKADALRQKRRRSIERLDDLLQSVFLEMFGDPVTNPKGWEIRPMEEIVADNKTSLVRVTFWGFVKEKKVSFHLVIKFMNNNMRFMMISLVDIIILMNQNIEK